MQVALNSSLVKKSVISTVSRRVWTKISVFLVPSCSLITSSWTSSATRIWILGLYAKKDYLITDQHVNQVQRYTLDKNTCIPREITRILSGFLGDVDQVLRDVAVGPAHHTTGDEIESGTQKVLSQSLDGVWKSRREHHSLPLGLRKDKNSYAKSCCCTTTVRKQWCACAKNIYVKKTIGREEDLHETKNHSA